MKLPTRKLAARHWFVFRVAGAFTLCLAATCAAPPPEVARTERPIINGRVDTDPRHDAVVALTDPDGEPLCTGTYIGQQTVVTAAHCFDEGPLDYVYFGVDAIDDNEACLAGDEEACYQFVEIAAYAVHPDYSPDGFTRGNDIALIDLGEDIDEVEPMHFLAFSAGTELTPADEGVAVALLGFGVTDPFTQTGAGMRRIADGTLDRLGPASFGWDGESFSLADDQLFSVQPDAGTCQGDSGGPLLIERNGVEFLAAVTSYGDERCASYGVSVTVDTHEDFIREFYGDDEIPGDDENPLDPGGDGENDGRGGDGGGCAVATPGSGSALSVLAAIVSSLCLLRRRGCTRLHRRL